ncbi:MAG: hypothetical protein ACF8XB_01670 [Planctomycetota bacterium JB042]
MSRPTILMTTLALALVPACADLPSPIPSGRFTGVDRFDADPNFLDELLAWPGGRDGTFGPTGDRLFADRLDAAPGLTGRFGMFHDTDALRDPIRIAFAVDDADAAPSGFEETWRPSHQETRFRVGPFACRERKFVTQDDLAVAVVSIENDDDVEHALTVRLSSSSAPVAAFADGALLPFDVSLATNRTAGPGATLPPRRILGGVPFETVPPSANAGRTLVADGGTHPPFLEIPIRREAVRLHLLTVAGPTLEAVPHGTVVATVQVFYPDGRPVVRPLRAGVDVGPGLGAVTVETNPRRTIAYVRFEAGDAPAAAIPAFAALTLEAYVEPLASQALLAERSLFDVPIRHALVGALLAGGRVVEHARVVDFAAAPHPLEARRAVPPGGRIELRAVHAFGLAGDDVRERAEERLESGDPFGEHRRRYHAWFRDLAPRLRSGEDAIDAVWWYRWFLLRRSLTTPAAGLLRGRCAFAGRHGADLARLDPAASTAAVLEARWLADPEIARDLLRAHVATATADGRFVAARVDTRQEPIPHRLAWAAEALHEVRPDRAFLREVLPALARDVEETGARLVSGARPGSDPRPARDVLANARATERLAREIGRDDLADAAAAIAARVVEAVPAAARPGDPRDDDLGLSEALAALEPDEVDAFLPALAGRHLARTEPPRAMLRETSDPRTGATPGRPDVLRVPWIDLVHRFADDVDWPSPWSRE